MLFVVLFVLMTVGCHVLIAMRRGRDLESVRFVAVVMAGLCFVIWLFSYPIALNDYARLKSYALVDKVNADAITQSAQAGALTADRVNDLRLSRVWYYQTLETYRLQTSNWVTRSFLPPLPADLRGK